MTNVAVQEDVDLTDPSLIEGFPGVGLVGKIAADHLVGEFDMTHHANVYCDSLPKVAVYRDGDAELQPPVRIYADADHDLLVLQSDVPVGPEAAEQLAACLAGWYDDSSVTPIYLSGIPEEKEDAPPALYGLGVGSGVDAVSEAGIDAPDEAGLVSGPTGVLLSDAVETGRTAVGLVVESDPRFPDPEAARVLIKDGIEPLTGVDVPVDHLVERTEQIRQAKERLAKRMQDAGEESTQARPIGMYQ
ncbi:proteasome assembly chaperone family protein [Halobellus ruber]|uniref:Proteasome assembly chaperone family protein n=1 Tax=Halobellus ruber TaxID=2761102 RepID=A0A7J9SHG2_9EURY|nr:PAC2 family protein [Halobellus ruber]MBB6645446.1 proteasome assembly chaperone family protein [Halobellus ruber]